MNNENSRERRSRPSSAENLDNQPPSRSASVENFNQEEKSSSRINEENSVNPETTSEQNTVRPSSGGKKPLSGEKRTSRPSSAQSQSSLSTLPENKQIKEFEEKVAELHSENVTEQDQLETSRLQNAEAVAERPSSSSKERKKKKSSRLSSRDSINNLERAVSPTDRRKSSDSKKSSKQEIKRMYTQYISE